MKNPAGLYKHRIVPGHIGGTYAPENVVLLTLIEHAEAHRMLFESHGRWQDKIAWMWLSGQVGHEEARVLAVRAANLGVKRGPYSAEHRAKIAAGHRGKKHSLETRLKLKATWAARRQSRIPSAETKAKLRAAQLGRVFSDETMAKLRKPKSDSAREAMRVAALARYARQRSTSANNLTSSLVNSGTGA